jgi:hypothetical protein
MMYRRRSESFIAAAAALGLSLLSCSPGNQFTVNEAIYLHEGDTLAPRGGGCTSVTLPGLGGAINAGPQVGDFEVAEGPDGDAYLVRVFSNHDLLALRRYDEGMLTSGRVDEFSVTTHAGAVYTLRYWGGPCHLVEDGAIE